MRFINLYFLILYSLLIYEKCKATVELRAIALTYSEKEKNFLPITNQFNEYAKENNIDIRIDVQLYSPTNSSLNVNDYGTEIEVLMKKKSEKYDLIFYDTMYSPRYAPYFLDLSKHMPKEHIDMYKNTIANKTCTYQGKWVGLPLSVGYEILYSNFSLLEKYGKKIPETWDELLETAKYIKEMEEKEGNNNVLYYNGLFPLYETAICSFQEFIHSYRETIESPYPDYSSPEALNALNKLKEIMNEISSGETFKSNDPITLGAIYSGNALFLKYWYIGTVHSSFKRSIIPGRNKGVSASTVGGTNIGINGYISEEKKKAALEALEYMTSLEGQRKYMHESTEFSALTELYDDEIVCKKYDCNILKKIQLIPRPSSVAKNYDEYSTQIRNYLYDFLYNGADASKTLEAMNDIVKIYNISIYPSESKEGFTILLVTIGAIVLILLSSVFFFIKKFKSHFSFFSIDSWVIFFLSFIVIISSIFTEYGEVTENKCQIRMILNTFGCSFLYIPILYKLITTFPEKNRFFNWIENSKFSFYLIFTLIDIFLCGLTFISTHNIIDINVKEGKKYRLCEANSFGTVLLSLIFAEKIIIGILIAFMLFLEWNIIKINREIKLITCTFYVNILSGIVLIIMKYMDLNNYKAHFLIYTIINLVYVLSCYFFMYGVRIFDVIIKKKEPKLKFIKQAGTVNSTLTERSKNSSTINYDTNSKFGSMTLKVLQYHYFTGEETKTTDDFSVPSMSFTNGESLK
ncbi:periplasmic binding protein-like II [Piromyces finnis]|uniref:Periplasmic binding protein-like II n=1 Tax=Piromyces finnis TaxID=1754191 RepID=A0A1Y1VMZ3_9FUNG|nr:periplasmic binding protein-like II [Piromyces finnis]|eukprot:ORX60797.1 periplasmic binding protein-like II [Piromyces finnis]